MVKTYKLVRDPSFTSQHGGKHPQKRLTEDDINQIYKNINVGFIEDEPKNKKQMVEKVYGEILFDSVEKLIRLLNIDENDIFYDLGSGNGKLVMQVFSNSPVKKAYGIEFFPVRSHASEKALKNLYKMHPDLLDEDRIISYQIQNIKDIHYLDDATIIFMCSTCFPKELLDVVYDKIENNQNLRYLITHKTNDKFKNILPNVEEKTLPCTWSKNVSWHIYSKN